MPYTRPYAGGFQDFPATTTPIDASALNTMDVGIKTANDQFQTVTTAQRATLTPTVGQAVWDSDLKQLMVYMNASGGNAWQPVGNRIVCASTTRPSSPFEGQEIYETDTNRTLFYTGAAWVGTETSTSLPVSPVDGQVVYYEADATNGVIWKLRYRSASASAYKWEFVGGGELTSNIVTNQAIGATVNSYVDLATVGPSVTVPLGGDYLIRWGGRFIVGATSSIGGMGIKLGSAAAPADANQGTRWVASAIPGANFHAMISSQDVATALSASAVVKAMYFHNNANQVSFGNRYMGVVPVRVG